MSAPPTKSNRANFLKELRPLLGSSIKAAEVGVFRGQYSKIILRDLQPTELKLIDAWRVFGAVEYDDAMNSRSPEQWLQMYENVKAKFKDRPEVEVIRELSTKAAARFPNGYFDFIYLDANHGFEAVLLDLKAWEPKLRAGGIMAGHDWGWRAKEQAQHPGVRKAVRLFLGDRVKGLQLTTEHNNASFYYQK